MMSSQGAVILSVKDHQVPVTYTLKIWEDGGRRYGQGTLTAPVHGEPVEISVSDADGLGNAKFKVETITEI